MEYACHNCGLYFDTPEWSSRKEDMNGEGAWWVYTYFICPRCGSNDIGIDFEDDEEDDGGDAGTDGV